MSSIVILYHVLGVCEIFLILWNSLLYFVLHCIHYLQNFFFFGLNSIRIFSIAAVVCLCLILPLNYFGQEMDHIKIPSESLDIFTIGNVVAKNKWYVYLISWYYFYNLRQLEVKCVIPRIVQINCTFKFCQYKALLYNWVDSQNCPPAFFNYSYFSLVSTLIHNWEKRVWLGVRLRNCYSIALTTMIWGRLGYLHFRDLKSYKRPCSTLN